MTCDHHLRFLHAEIPTYVATPDIPSRSNCTTTHLSLSFTAVHGPGLKFLSDVPMLETLSLAYTDIDDEGLASLPELRSLRRLYLGRTRVTDAGISTLALKRFDALENLSLAETAIGDQAVEHLTAFKKLTQLGLYRTRITDKALDTIEKLYGLRVLGCGLSGLSRAGVERLRVQCPNLIVDDGD